MRPLNLKVKGFTSFRDEQEIDFTDLDVFVLWGQVGAGKSSLLDAMTYALFGHVERVGNQVSQLVSHGQPRLAVLLEFAVDNDVYRVKRSTSHKGQSTALLERRVGDAWESFGEGADRVREVTKSVEQLIGLDYQAFTRAVVLPQGKFAEFLTGDAAKRREILTELLGLELFKRMSQRANEISKNAKVHLDTKSELLEREYAGVDAQALDRARQEHASAQATVQAAVELEKKLTRIEQKWVVADRARKALAACVTEVRDAAETFAEAGASLDAHARMAKAAGDELTVATAALKQAQLAAAGASKKRATAEGKWGSVEDLVALKTKATSIEDARSDYTEAVSALDDTKSDIESLGVALKEATELVATKKKAVRTALTAAEKAEMAHADAHKRDAVGGLVSDLKPGDPCPICDRPLESIPKSARKEIDAAKKALDKARAAAEAAREEQRVAETDLALVQQRTEASKEKVARCNKEIVNRKGRLELLVKEVSSFTRGGDPVEQIDLRLTDLRKLMADEESALRAVAETERELERKKLAASKVSGEIDKVKVKMVGVPLTPICARVRDAASEIDVVEALPTQLPDGADELATIASAMSKELSKLADELDGLQQQRDRELEKLVHEAGEALPSGLSLDVSSITEVVAHTRATTSQLKVDEGLMAKAVNDLSQRLETKARYEQEIHEHREEHAVYRDLQRELRSDSIVQYLQAEALRTLARAASTHLEGLSSSRYRLAYEDDRFFVIDSWNGDERRSISTLSGGETFQASLAFALALSEQVQYLAVTERGRLDSLFLDEGFDTQDTETLDVVVDAIEQLGSDGRLVGVITHVRPLAESFPVRLEVTKTPRGSTVRRTDQEFVPQLK